MLPTIIKESVFTNGVKVGLTKGCRGAVGEYWPPEGWNPEAQLLKLRNSGIHNIANESLINDTKED